MLGPWIKASFHWDNSTFALLIIAFRIAYAGGQSVCGRLVDYLGIRRGLSITVGFPSFAAMLTSFATGLRSLCLFPFLLGAGESANCPLLQKPLRNGSPRKESGWAVALFDSGSAVGGAIAPVLIYHVYRSFGDWRPAFVVTGLLGLLGSRSSVGSIGDPRSSRLSPAEREYIRMGGETKARTDSGNAVPTVLLKIRNLGHRDRQIPHRSSVVFITDRFAIYLVSRGFRAEESLLAFWAPFLAADIGASQRRCFRAGSSAMGWSTGKSRRLVALVSGIGMSALTHRRVSLLSPLMVMCFAISTLCYAAFSTIVLALPADLYHTNVASVSGLSGTAGIGTIAATYLTGVVSDRYSFEPILIGAAMIPLIATAAVMLFIRNGKATERGLINPI